MEHHLGSCLCGEIRYEIYGKISNILNCHCSDCRKSHGAAFRTRGEVKSSDFKFVSGEDLLTRYEHKTGEHRSFCSHCGSNIATFFDDLSTPIGLALGTLDSQFEEGAQCHVFTSDKAKWHKIEDSLPQFSKYPT